MFFIKNTNFIKKIPLISNLPKIYDFKRSLKKYQKKFRCCVYIVHLWIV